MQIDFVIPWVDGSDPEWILQRSQFSSDSIDTDACRFRDWDLLRYWFRAVEKHAPWVNRIYFVTCGQIPSWLNRDHPKLQIVNHCDYIPQAYLPTFSSHTIELNLHRIPGLSEQFVYFNDDMFLNKDVLPEDFFQNGLPRDSAVLEDAILPEDDDAFAHAQKNVISFLNRHFSKTEVLASYGKLWLHPCYGKYIIKNLIHFPGKSFSGIRSFHIPSSIRKSSLEAVWTLEPELLHKTCKNRFRSTKDVNQYIATNYQFCTGSFSPRSPGFGKCYRIGKDNKAMYTDIRTGKHKVLCLNDHPNIDNFEQEKKELLAIFQKKYPDASQFEIANKLEIS